MFHQVHLKTEDRDAVRFLWKREIDGTIERMQMLVHIFGATDSPSCASYALKRTINDNAERFDPITIETTRNSFYMDDLMKSVVTLNDAYMLSLQLREMLSLGGFNLVKFLSNSKELLQLLPPDILAKPVESLYFNGDETKTIERALGVKWHISADQFTFTTMKNNASTTKRGILSVSSSIFDPLGLLSPFILRAKVILQELWRLKVAWDDPIDGVLKEQWCTWLSELKYLPSISISRVYGPIGRNQLHIFCDASELAFAAVAYLRIITDDTITCSMLFSKSRLAPLKTLTIPRLELQAAVLAVRMKTFILTEIDFPIESTHFWTDSTIVLQYINQESKRFKTFVANRLAEILGHSEIEQWRHIKGTENPSDCGTRGLKLLDMTNDCLWFKGPPFLYQYEGVWPQQALEDCENLEYKVFTAHVNTVKSGFNFARFSNWYRMISVVAWILRWRNRDKVANLGQVINYHERKIAE